MARLFDGSADFATDTSLPQLGTGTIAGWIHMAALPGATDRDVFCTVYEQSQGEPFSTNDKELFMNSSGIVKARIFDGANKLAATTTGISTGSWHHIGMTFDGTNLRVWLDGVNEGTTAAGNSFTGFTDPSFRLCGIVGGLADGETTVTRANARLAEWAIWTGILTTNDFAMLAKGFPVSRVRPSTRLRYWPIWGASSPEPDYSGNGGSLTLTSAPPLANHVPGGPPFGFAGGRHNPAAAAAGGALIRNPGMTGNMAQLAGGMRA